MIGLDSYSRQVFNYLIFIYDDKLSNFYTFFFFFFENGLPGVPELNKIRYIEMSVSSSFSSDIVTDRTYV